MLQYIRANAVCHNGALPAVALEFRAAGKWEAKPWRPLSVSAAAHALLALYSHVFSVEVPGIAVRARR